MRMPDYYRPTIGSSVRLLLDEEYYQQIFLALMLNYFPFSKEEINRLSIDYSHITGNPNVDWSQDNIRIANNHSNTNCLSLFDNASIIWDSYLLENVGLHKIDWVYLNLSNKKNVRWTEDFIKKNKRFFDWDELTTNPYVGWSEDGLMALQNEVSWAKLIENPSIKWTSNLVSKVRSSLTDIGWRRKEYAEKALEFGFNPDNDNNIFEKATDFLKQFDLYSPDSSFRDIIWKSIANNDNIKWTENCLKYHPKLNLETTFRGHGHYCPNPNCEEVDYKAFDFDKDFIEELDNISGHCVDLCYIPITNTHFWNRTTLSKYYLPVFDGKYGLNSLCYNRSVSWDVSLFTFFKEHNCNEWLNRRAFAKRKRFFDFLYNQYGREELLNFFEDIFGKVSFFEIYNDR